MQALISYVLVAMLSWVPVRSLVTWGETEAEARARLESIATDIVTVAMDPSEPPAFTGPDGRVKTSLLQASIASLETGFQKFVDEGACNKPGYTSHADRRGNCDGGHAWSMWQIHIFGDGYLLLNDGSLGSVTGSPAYAAAHPDEVVKGPELVADRRTAVRVAQRLERSSLKQYHSLCAYSGESCVGDHPKASVRFDRAKDYFAHHPFMDPTPAAIGVAQTSTVTPASYHSN